MIILRCKDCGRSSNRKSKSDLCPFCDIKKNHNKYGDTISHIEKAIKSLGQDHISADVRQSLTIALNKLTKKNKVKSPMETMKEKAMNLNNDWWSTIEEAVKKQDITSDLDK